MNNTRQRQGSAARIKLVGPQVTPNSKLDRGLVKAWHGACGPDDYCDFQSAAAWDMIQAVLR
jgi:hypothetical protein